MKQRRLRKDLSSRYVMQQLSGQKRFRSDSVACIIKSLVPQGDYLYAIARYKDQTVENTDGTTTTVSGGLVGNEGNLDESTLVLAECMIITDINFSSHRGINLESIIGAEAKVEIIDNRPKKILISYLIDSPRTIPSSIIQQARGTNPDRSLDNDNARRYIVEEGYTEDEYNSIINENFSDIDPEGYILVYGDLADWVRESQEDTSTSHKDISSYVDTSTITNLPSSTLKSRICYSAPTILSGF